MKTKHTLITKKLRQRIINGQYSDKLPPLRALMQEFKVSMQTISKAVKPLAVSGFITTSPRGSIINYFGSKRVKYYTIGFLCKKINDNTETQEFLNKLSKKMLYKNYNTIFLNCENKRLKDNSNFWKTCPIDILIFGYGTLTKKLAMDISRSGIIPLARHYAGDLPVHVCEFETFNAIESVVSQFRSKGYRKIALQFFTPLVGYHDFAVKKWLDICNKYDVDCPGCEKPLYLLDQPFELEKTLPEIILCWHVHYELVLKKIAFAGLKDKIKVVSFSLDSMGYDNYIPLNPPSMKLYWEVLNDFLKSTANAKPLEYLHCKVPFDAVFPYKILPKK